MTDKKLIPFDLECAIAGDPLITRDGRKVIKFHYFSGDDLQYPIVAHIDGEDRLYEYVKDGEYYPNIPTECDLFMAPKKKNYQVNIYRNIHDGYLRAGNPYQDGIICIDAIANSELVKIISFEVEE